MWGRSDQWRSCIFCHCRHPEGTKLGSYAHGFFMLQFAGQATEIRFLHIFSSPVQHFIFQQRRRWASCQVPDADTRPGNRFHAPMFVYILNVNTEQSGDGDWDNLGHDGMPSDKRTFFLCSPGHGNWWGIWNTQWSPQRRTPRQSPQWDAPPGDALNFGHNWAN